MNSFTRVALPILLVVLAVSGITIIQMYSGDEPTPDSNKGGSTANPAKVAVPLRFDSALAVVPPPEATEEDKKKFAHLLFWDDHYEAGAPGHYEFWCQNRNDQPAMVHVTNTNCQCVSVDLAVVPPDAYREYLVGSALASGPFGNTLAGVMAHMSLEKKLSWVPLFHTDPQTLKVDQPNQTVPAANAATGPQFALVRLNWEGKGESTRKTISADLFSKLGEDAPAHTHLESHIIVLPTFEMMAREDDNRWRLVRSFEMGDLRENAISKRTLYLACATRPFVSYSITPEHEDACVQFSEPKPATEEELKSLREFMLKLPGDTNPPAPRHIKSLQKIEISVRERLPVDEGGKRVLHQLDLGPIDRRVKVQAFEGGNWNLTLKGRVFGEITLLSGAETGQVELGNSLAADQMHSRDVHLLAERRGLDLALVKADIFPAYLQESKLESLPPLADGRKQWRLRVILPKNALFGHLPENSTIVLITTGPNPRRIRIPVRGSTFQSGGPRL